MALDLPRPDALHTVVTAVRSEKIIVEHMDVTDLPEEDQEPDRDYDEEQEHEAPAHKASASERKLGDREAFNVWLTRRAERATDEPCKTHMSDARDDVLTLRTMLARQESNKIVSDPREYQLELFERAKKDNIIAVLPTGSGKTLVAVLLLRQFLDEEMETRKRTGQKKVAFFLVDKVALCFQQFAVLEANIDHSVARICGDVNFSVYNKPSWDQLFQDHDVIVCTAEILYQSLGKAFISMDGINLLVFDEAHHCKKGHPYARIIKEFYIRAPANQRPRVFGMSASPADSNEDVEDSATRLETLLHCRVATTANLSLLQQHNVGRPEELLVRYARPSHPYLTKFAETLKGRFQHLRAFKKLFSSAKGVASELGEWCADHFWSLALSDDELLQMLSHTEQEYQATSKLQTVETLNSDLRHIKEAAKLVSDSMPYGVSDHTPSVSDKVQQFVMYVRGLYEASEEPRCLVFVERRLTASLLASLLTHLDIPNVHLGVLIGVRKRQAAEQAITIREQMIRILKFRKGELNLLIATSVAEEGLDIPDCNCVIRFDLYSTTIQYVQSRGRARHKNSKFVLMVEDGNSEQRSIIKDACQGEAKMQEFCSKLPADRLLEGNDRDIHEVMGAEKDLPIHTEAETKAQLTFYSAMECLAYFVSCIPQKEESLLRVHYEMFYDRRQFYCEAVLPDAAPIQSVAGRPYPRKALAKRSAAFEACLKLRAKGYMTSGLLPIYQRQLPALRNAHLALNVKTTNSYKMRTKPLLWEQARGSLPTQLYITVIKLSNPRVLGQDAASLALLTRSQLPQFPSFPIYPGADCRAEALSGSTEIPIDTTNGERLELLTAFTLRIFQDIFNKKYRPVPADMSYWLAPLVTAPKEGCCCYLLDQGYDIDWTTLAFVQTHEDLNWDPDMPDSKLEGKFVIDLWDGARRFFSEAVEKSLKPSDPVPQGCAPHRFRDSVIDYSVSLFRKSRAKQNWMLHQPVIRGQLAPIFRNWLDEWPLQTKEAPTLVYFCPQPLKISALPASIVAMGYALPAIIHRLEEYLIVRDGASIMGLPLKLDLCLEAMTKDSDNTEEHKDEQIQFQRGMGKNYERLEFIGDTFLKMATSISLFAQNAEDDEFESHVKRMIMICNKNLFNHALKQKVYEFIRSKSFNRRTWYPEGLVLLEGKGKNQTYLATQHHNLNDKSVADVCEAMIGAALLSERETYSMDMAVKAVTIMVQNPDHDAERFSDYAKQYCEPAWISEPATVSQMDLADQIYATEGYRFQRPRLLRSAFLHPSYAFARERIPCYQRLEFLGDALLDMACVNFLYHRYPARDPQWLTEHKMAMVSNKFLGALCVRLGFHRHLRYVTPVLVHAIADYTTELNEARRAAAGRPDYWLAARTAPKCLPDVVEAYVGALFIDAGFDFDQVERFFERQVAPFFADMTLYDAFANRHPTTFLANVLQQRLGCRYFRVLADELPTLESGRVVAGGCGVVRVAAAALVHGRVVGEAEGTSVRYAKVRASKAAADKIKDLDRETFRRRFKCDCSEDDLEDAALQDDLADAVEAGERGEARLGDEDAQQVVWEALGPGAGDGTGVDEDVQAMPAVGGLVIGSRLSHRPQMSSQTAEGPGVVHTGDGAAKGGASGVQST